MATTKPRVTVTLEPEVHELYRDLAEIQGCSMSSLIAGLLEVSLPVQRKVLEAFRAVTAVQSEGRAEMLDRLDKAHLEATEVIGPLMALLAEFGQSQPPHSNTGVTPPNPPTRTDQKIPAKRRSRAVQG